MASTAARQLRPRDSARDRHREGCFFPLANKSYESMAKMKKLQPEMEKLRERYKDDRPSSSRR